MSGTHSYTGLKTSPTLTPYRNFNAESDSDTLRKAMKGLGTDEQAIIDILAKRTADQRVQIAKQYKTMFGRDLVDDLKSELSGKFEDVVVAMICSLDQFDARELNRAMKGAGTDEATLIEILCSRTDAQIRQIKKVYAEEFGRELEEDIKGDTSGDFRKILIGLVQANRSTQLDAGQIKSDTQELLDAGPNRWGTDESVFQKILVAKSREHVEAVMSKFEQSVGKPFEESLKSEFSGDLLDTYVAIAQCLRDTPRYFALRLKDSMAGAGTNDRQLIRIIVSRCEIDMKEIKDRFFRETEKTLEEWIQDDTSGDYKRMLLALIA